MVLLLCRVSLTFWLMAVMGFFDLNGDSDHATVHISVHLQILAVDAV